VKVVVDERWIAVPVFGLVSCGASPVADDAPCSKRTALLMPYRPTAAGAIPPTRVAGMHCAAFFCLRFAARRYIDLQRVSSAVCQS
jgi:hypothetical protein